MKYQVFPLKKMSYAVKIEFLSFTCEDIKVAMTSSMSATSKYYQYYCTVSRAYYCTVSRAFAFSFLNQVP